MADTVSKNMSDDEYKEYIDTPSVRKKKIQELAEMIKKHRGRVIFFTGAGSGVGIVLIVHRWLLGRRRRKLLVFGGQRALPLGLAARCSVLLLLGHCCYGKSYSNG